MIVSTLISLTQEGRYEIQSDYHTMWPRNACIMEAKQFLLVMCHPYILGHVIDNCCQIYEYIIKLYRIQVISIQTNPWNICLEIIVKYLEGHCYYRLSESVIINETY